MLSFINNCGKWFMDASYFINGIFNSVSGWLLEHGVRVFGILIAATIINRLIRAFLSRKKLTLPTVDSIIRPRYKEIISKGQRQRIQTIVNAMRDTFTFVVYVIAILMVLPELGINIAPILAGLGLVGLAVGMAAKDILADFLTGFFIILEDEYNVGDTISIAGVTGKVLAISLRRTILRDEEGSVHLVPNREIKLIKRFAEKKPEAKKEPDPPRVEGSVQANK